MPLCGYRSYFMKACGSKRQLDRAAFEKTVVLKALSLPKQDCHRYMKLLKRCAAVPSCSSRQRSSFSRPLKEALIASKFGFF